MWRIRGNALAIDFGGMRFIGVNCLVNLGGCLPAKDCIKSRVDGQSSREKWRHRQAHSHPSHPAGQVRRGKMSVLLTWERWAPARLYGNSIQYARPETGVPGGGKNTGNVQWIALLRTVEEEKRRHRRTACATFLTKIILGSKVYNICRKSRQKIIFTSPK